MDWLSEFVPVWVLNDVSDVPDWWIWGTSLWMTWLFYQLYWRLGDMKKSTDETNRLLVLLIEEVRNPNGKR